MIDLAYKPTSLKISGDVEFRGLVILFPIGVGSMGLLLLLG